MSLSLLVQTVPKAKANSVWQQELLMRMSLRNSICRPQSNAQQTHLTPLQLIPLAPIKHKEDILGEVSVCPQVRSPSCIKSQIFQKVAISFWQIVTMGEWFLGYHLYSSSVKLQKNAGKTHMESTSTIKRMGGVWLESTAQMELWHRTDRPGLRQPVSHCKSRLSAQPGAKSVSLLCDICNSSCCHLQDPPVSEEGHKSKQRWTMSIQKDPKLKLLLFWVARAHD